MHTQTLRIVVTCTYTHHLPRRYGDSSKRSSGSNPTPPTTPCPPNGADYTRINPKHSARLAALIGHKFKPAQAEAVTKHIVFNSNDVGYITEVLKNGEHVFERCPLRKEETPILVPPKSLCIGGTSNRKGWKVVHMRTQFVRTSVALGQLNSASAQKFKRHVEVRLEAIKNNESQIPNLGGEYKALVGLAGHSSPPQPHARQRGSCVSKRCSEARSIFGRPGRTRQSEEKTMFLCDIGLSKQRRSSDGHLIPVQRLGILRTLLILDCCLTPACRQAHVA